MTVEEKIKKEEARLNKLMERRAELDHQIATVKDNIATLQASIDSAFGKDITNQLAEAGLSKEELLLLISEFKEKKETN